MKLFSTSCESLFLDWTAPLLPRAVDQLLERYAKGEVWDLSSLLCVLPTRRAADRLRTLLGWASESAKFQLVMPEVITIGELPEQLYQPPRNIALDFEQTLAWTQVLTTADPESLRDLLSVLPPPRPISPWMELAGTLRRLHSELASSERTFADVIDLTETPSERRRWELLTRLYDQYLLQINSADLCDPHWARRDAILRGRYKTEKTLVLIGVSDVSELVVSILRTLDAEMIAMIAAPESAAQRFDEFGCVDTRTWVDHELPVKDEQLISASDVSDQALAVAEVVADFAGAHSADEVTVGVTDASQIGPIEVELRGCGVETHRQIGWTVAETAVGRLLELTTTFLQRGTWQSLAAFVRHADVYDHIDGQLNQDDPELEPGSWLRQLDAFLAEHFPVSVADDIVPMAAERYPLVPKVAEIVQAVCADFVTGELTIAQWCGKIKDWLDILLGDDFSETLDRQRTVSALESVQRLLTRFQTLSGLLDVPVPGVVAMETVSNRLDDLRVGETANPQDVEILGWLDLAMDDAPALVVNGLNHPFVPAAVTSDPFLPGTLRSQLRVADNERRYARDVYAMHLMLMSRRSIKFVVGKNAADGSPTPPSRLIAAAPPVDSARRVRRLLSEQREPVSIQHRWDAGESQPIPIPVLPEGDIEKLIPYVSVTGFKDFLTCPYRFYLRHVLKLRPLDDSSSELAANQFGDLVHGAVELFGQSPHKDECSQKEIQRHLIDFLHQYAQQRYGGNVSTAVRLQIVQAEKRLQAVAREQADRREAGWIIHATEASATPKEHNSGVDVDGKRMGLSGRFDRIDYHAKDDRWAILDYKTHGHKPEKKHLKKTADGDVWVDLQLPLYRLMIPFLGIDAEPETVQLGYFNVSDKDTETRVNIAEFTEPQMADAIQVIQDCIRSIRTGRFEPTDDRVMFDDYQMILQMGVANRLLDLDDLLIGEEVEV